MDAMVMTDGRASNRNQFTGGVGEGFTLLFEVVGDELLVVAAGDKTYLLGIGLVGEGEMAFARDLADLGLGEVAEGEESVGKLVLGESKEEPGLVLGEVGGALEDPAVARGVVLVAGVVAGGDAGGTDLARGEQKLVELEVIVAERAGNWRAASEVIIDKGTNDVALEALLLVDDVVGDVERLGDAAGVVYVVERAAATGGAGGYAGLSGEAILIPKLEGEADDIGSLGAKHGGNGGGIDAAGHGYGDGFAGHGRARAGGIGQGAGGELRTHRTASASAGDKARRRSTAVGTISRA
uniref:Uncharacterized protein n=1 Tax=mine drainage metagenome TaxID=410659 RepID=E6QM66_9ZZZZ